MPDPVTSPSAPPATPLPTSTPPGTTAPASPVAAEPWRAGANAPRWAQGKSAEEILGIADALLQAAPAPAPAAPVAPPQPTFDDNDYLTGAQVKQYIAAQQNNNGAVELAASANLGLLRSQYASDFNKYGHEITAKLSGVPKNLWTLDNLETVVKLVRADHLDEIAQERATQLAANMPGTIRSTGAGSDFPAVNRETSLESEKIPAEWKRRAAAANVTERIVDEFCRANDITPAEFYKQFDTPMTRIVEDIPQRRNA